MSDPFEQIGAKLKSARESAGLEIPEVAAQSGIPRQVIEDLEAENFSEFASPVYAKSFLLQYSEFLNVDAATWLVALEPGAFMPSGQTGALLKGPEMPRQEHAVTEEERSGMMAVFALFGLSAAIIYGAIKGYEYFDGRLGNSPPRTVVPQSEPPAGPPSRSVDSPLDSAGEGENAAVPVE